MTNMTNLSFAGDVALVTGAGRGIGRAHAVELARRGARVVVNDLGGRVDGADGAEDPAADVVAEIEAAGGQAVANHDSVATPEGGAAMVAQAVDAFGRIDIVVNNAGILRDKSFGKLTADLVDPVLDVHLRGAFHVTIPAWAHMKAQGHGRIINTSSGSGLFGNFGQANYGAAKAGLAGLTRVLAVEGRKAGIHVNAIAPAALTRMTEDILGDNGHLLSPESIAPVVAFLASRACELNGQILSVGGGHVAAVLTTETQGITEKELTAEAVRDRLGEIFDTEGAFTPRHLGDELKELVAALKKVSS
ncbi:SDR family NAD(P)-dependent oxidoreductase [Streptomyces sp. NPDC051218]|uniref:SDR family NAD(P)-dependent oxidoreductase n=1 Tax=Streptomyces sp. NPDC051218 TaxID=3365645 RepID=UPI00379B2484